MSKKLFALTSALVLAILVFSTALAGGGVKLAGVAFSLGSLKANGNVSGIGNTDVVLVLDGTGIPAITCTNGGSNDVPGQSSPKVTAEGTQNLLGNDAQRKNGKAAFGVETLPPAPLSWSDAGCPNANWTARIDFIYWTSALIRVYDTATPPNLLLAQNYTCITNRTTLTVSCTAVP